MMHFSKNKTNSEQQKKNCAQIDRQINGVHTKGCSHIHIPFVHIFPYDTVIQVQNILNHYK